MCDVIIGRDDLLRPQNRERLGNLPSLSLSGSVSMAQCLKLVSRASLTSKESESGRLCHTSVPPARILAEPMKTEY